MQCRRTGAFFLVVSLMGLAACDPVQMTDKVGRRAAETVVQPIVDDYMTGPEAEVATRCIVDNASADQIKEILKDVGVGAGPRTVRNVMGAAANPGAMSCMAAAGLPRLGA